MTVTKYCFGKNELELYLRLLNPTKKSIILENIFPVLFGQDKAIISDSGPGAAVYISCLCIPEVKIVIQPLQVLHLQRLQLN